MFLFKLVVHLRNNYKMLLPLIFVAVWTHKYRCYYFGHLFIIKRTRCTNFSNLFLE